VRDSGLPKSRFAESLKKIGDSLLKLFRGDFLVFLLFLCITFFFWWSQTMSQDYETVMKLPVQVTGVSDDVRVTMPAASQIFVSLSGKGSALRKSGRRGGKHILQVHSSTFNMSQGHASLSTQRLRDSVSALLPVNVSIREIEPDSLVFQYALQRSVMLPVTFDGTTESQDQFFMERIEFQPDSIQAKVLLSDTVAHSVLADAGQISLSSDTTVLTVPVKPVPGVQFSASQVRMTVIAQQYTEKSIEVPITGVNFPDYLSLKSFPSKAVVLAWVKMSEYDKVSAKDFQVVVDYNDIAGRDGSKAVLRIFSQPANVRNVRLHTRTVDYLMERKLF
jgi:hypothetical protein